MTSMIVNVEGLNLRTQPSVAPNSVLRVLHLGEAVDVKGVASSSVDWDEVSVLTGQGVTHGFVKRNIEGISSLRDRVQESREALVAEAVKQWKRFAFGQGLEHHNPYYKYVGEMWSALGSDLDGQDRDIPWSAAAISFMVRNAAVKVSDYGRFKFASSHARYLHESIVKRNNHDPSAPFWGYRLHERPPQIGDIVARWRDTPKDFDDAATQDSFKSHSDIIVSIRPNHLLAIGGNVGHSVSISRYEKSGPGYITTENQAFMLMVNQL